MAIAFLLPQAQAGAATEATVRPTHDNDIASIVDAFTAKPMLFQRIRAHVEEQVQYVSARDPQVNLRLKANAALRTALVDRVDAYYQSEIIARLPGVRDRLASLLSREMTSTQILATSRMLTCETGRRLVEHGLKNALAESLGREVADDLSDAEAEALVAKNDIPVIMEFSRTGADVKFEKISEEMEGMQADLFEPILQGEEAFILNVLEELISVLKNAI